MEFNSPLKENVKLKMSVDIEYVKANPSSLPAFHKENILTDAILSSLNSLDNLRSPSCGSGLLNPEWKNWPSNDQSFQRAHQNSPIM